MYNKSMVQLMDSKKLHKLVKTARGTDPDKVIQALVDIHKVYQESPESAGELPAFMVKYLRNDSERVREAASLIILNESETNPRLLLRQFRALLQTLKWDFNQMKSGELDRFTPVTNIVMAMGNLVDHYPELGGRLVSCIARVLTYPLFRPQNLNTERNLLYMSAINVIGKIGNSNPIYVDSSVPHIYKCLVDSFRFDFWKKDASERKNNMRMHASNALMMIGSADPIRVVPWIIPALNEENWELVEEVRRLLLGFSENLRTFLPALMCSLGTGKQAEREKVTEFIIEQGQANPRYVIPLLGLALSDKRANVRCHSAYALGSLLPGHAEFIPSITPLLVNGLVKETDNEAKRPMADTLTVISFMNLGVFKNLIPQIIHCMKDDYHLVRWRMAQIIKNIGIFKRRYVVDAIPNLITGLDDFYIPVQQKSEEALNALRVDKFDYLRAIRNIASGTKALEHAREEGKVTTEAQNALVESIKAARDYGFRRSVELSSVALDLMEAAGVQVSRYVSSLYPGTSAPSSDIPAKPIGYREIGSLPIPPPPDDAFSLPLTPGGADAPPFIPPAKEVELAGAASLGIDEVFLMTTYGILIDHYAVSKKSKVDEEVLASMLVAVKSFITDSFDLPDTMAGGKMNLNNIDFGDFSVIISTGKLLTIVAITTSGNKDSIYDHLMHGIEKLEIRYQVMLKTWNGDMEALGDLPEYMKELVLK